MKRTSLTIEHDASKSPQRAPLDRRFSLSGWSVALIVTLAAAFLIRIWDLGSMPAALHPDELAGVSGVLDELSHRAPVRAFFDYRIMYLPLYGICEYVMTWFFGNSAAALRFPAVVFGVATVYFTIELTRRLTNDRSTALLAGGIMALLPWDVTVSRVGWEPAAMLPFILAALVALRAGLDSGRSRLVVLAGVLCGVASYSYRAALPDCVVLIVAMLLCNVPRARAMWRAVIAGLAAWILVLSPLIVSVSGDFDFFWRDRRISTFADGINADSLVLFWHNYVAHFAFAPLFLTGDGNANHGPAYGVLYPWMLPFVIAGAFYAWKRYGPSVGAFLWIWLLLYPTGGAFTNDGVPHFLRTLIGAPLACILCAAGLVAVWRALSKPSLQLYRTWGTGLLCALAVVEFSAFCRSYFVLYAGPSADANHFEDRELFAVVRTLEPKAARVCFLDLNGMNSLTLFSYYMRSSHLELIEGQLPECLTDGTITVTNNPARAARGARLVATVENYEGVVADYIYLKPILGAPYTKSE